MQKYKSGQKVTNYDKKSKKKTENFMKIFKNIMKMAKKS